MKKLIFALFLFCNPAFADGLIIPPSRVGVAAVGQIPGTATNDNACAGCVGEEIVSIVGTPASLAGASALNITSISLSPGDWDIDATANFFGGATTIVLANEISIGTVSATRNTVAGVWSPRSYGAGVTLYSNGNADSAQIPPFRLSVASQTTYYLVAYSLFTTSTNTTYGSLRARRVR